MCGSKGTVCLIRQTILQIFAIEEVLGNLRRNDEARNEEGERQRTLPNGRAWPNSWWIEVGRSIVLLNDDEIMEAMDGILVNNVVER